MFSLRHAQCGLRQQGITLHRRITLNSWLSYFVHRLQSTRIRNKHIALKQDEVLLRIPVSSRFALRIICSRPGEGGSGDPPGTKTKSSETSSKTVNPIRFESQKPSTLPPVKVVPMKKVETDTKYMTNVFITPVRAFREYLLTPQEMQNLWSTKRRSPYESTPPITVYLRRDAEKAAIAKFGSLKLLESARQKSRMQEELYLKGLTPEKPLALQLNELFRNTPHNDSILEKERKTIFKSGSGKVVLVAIAINGLNAVAKSIAWLYTGSHVMFAEMVHSMADTANQCILAYGIHQSLKNPNPDHPYGFTNMRYVTSLISGVGIFCTGSGLSFYHGFQGLFNSGELVNLTMALALLAGSFISESATLYMAIKNIKRKAKQANQTAWKYVRRGQDPSVNVVLMEDIAAVTGVAVAASAMTLSLSTGSHIPDAAGSFVVGSLLACVSAFIVKTNTDALLGRSIPPEDQQTISQVLESDIMIRSVHDIKATDMGSNLIRFKAEVDFDGRLLTSKYLNERQIEDLMMEMKKCDTPEKVEEFMLYHGEKIVEMIGGEIDRIESILKKTNPQIRHVDLEML